MEEERPSDDEVPEEGGDSQELERKRRLKEPDTM